MVGFAHRFLQDEFGNIDVSTSPHDARQFPEDLRASWIQIEDAIHERDVYRRRLQWQAFGITLTERDVDTIHSSGFSGAHEHRFAEVDPDYSTGGSYTPGHDEGVESRPASKVENASFGGDCGRDSQIRDPRERLDGHGRQGVQHVGGIA
jgi:hypothetical protein